MVPMEDYDKFVQNRLSQLRRKEEEDHLRPAASAIRFHGRAILPPLLSGKQREEMQRYRDEMQKAAVCTKSSVDPRLACVQILLHSVQLRKTPTLDELLQEPEITTRCLYSRNTSNDSVPQSDVLSGTKQKLSPPAREESSSFCLPPLTSTTHSAFFNSDRTPQQTYHERCLIDQRDSQQESQPSSFNGASHQSLSSGYVTYVNVEDPPSVPGGIDAGSESPCFGSSQGFFNMGGFFHHNTSSTIAKMPDIISYPPIDGDELERSGLEMSLCSNVCGVKDISGSSFQEDSATCDSVPAEQSESSHLDSVEHEGDIPSADCDTDENVHHNEESDNSDVSQMSNCHHALSKDRHVLQYPKEAEPIHSQVEEADSVPSEEPYRLSLQALLKKSQEYRRRQRMLRNRAKNTKIQERTQEQPGARTEEPNLSDKENDEFPHMGTVTAGGKKTKERRDAFIPSVETSTKNSWDNDKMVEDEFISVKMNNASEVATEEENMKALTSFEEGTTFKNNQLNIPQKIITSYKESRAFIQQQPASAEPLNPHDAFYLTTCSTSFHKGPQKYRNVPVPLFCRSPTTFKNKCSIRAVGGETSRGKCTFSAGLNEDHSAEGVNLDHTVTPSAVNLIVEGDVASVLAKSSQNIDQLESNLSLLKVLISDLESTVKENLDNQCQTESNTQSELSFKSIKHSEHSADQQRMMLSQSDSDCREDQSREDDGNDADHRQCPRSQSFSNGQCMKVDENLGPDPNFSDVEAVHLTHLGKETDTVIELRGNESEMNNEALTKTQLQNPPAKCISSVAQRRHIPDIFRTAPSETTAPRGVSVLSETRNHHPVERNDELSAGGHGSICSPSLNQSYDVDTPSDLWLHEGSGSGVSSQGHLVQEDPLTPESRGEGEEGASKVKRRLLMHVTEESPNDRAAGGSAFRSSSPIAHSREANGAQKDKREQLKEIHAAQVRALQAEHRKQQEELQQALAVRYRLLQSVSFPCSMSGSRLGDTVTFSTLSKPPSSPLQHYRPLLAAAAKGFLTRRLLRTERVAQLVRTIRDTRQFLQAFQQQLSPGREFCSRQDLFLQERVTLQLRAARYEVYDIFFSLSVREQMQLISWDRELAIEREHRRQSGNAGRPQRKSSLSAATQKSLERKRGVLIQKKTAERNRVVRANPRQKIGTPPEQLPGTKRGQIRANPQRVSKSSFSCRPR